jgi:hypothetical protein
MTRRCGSSFGCRSTHQRNPGATHVGRSDTRSESAQPAVRLPPPASAARDRTVCIGLERRPASMSAPTTAKYRTSHRGPHIPHAEVGSSQRDRWLRPGETERWRSTDSSLEMSCVTKCLERRYECCSTCGREGRRAPASSSTPSCSALPVVLCAAGAWRPPTQREIDGDWS